MTHFDIWNSYMMSYDFLNQIDSYAKNLCDVADAVRVRPGERVLDAGSGTGNLSTLLKRRGVEVVSCDFSPVALAKHRAKDRDAIQVEASLENPLPFDDAEFDAVCCASVLFALTQSGCQLAVREFNRVLKPGGRVVVTVPAPNQRNKNLIGMHFQGLKRKHGRLMGWSRGIVDLPCLLKILYYGRALGRLPDWQGWHRFTADEICKLLSDAKFDGMMLKTTYGACFLLLAATKASTPVWQRAMTSVAASYSAETVILP